MRDRALELYFEIDSQMQELKRQLCQRTGYPHNLKELKNALQIIIDGKFVNADCFPVNVDFGSTLNEVIAAGNFGWVNTDINGKNFPTEGSGQLEMRMQLMHFGRRIKSDEVALALEVQCLRPAILHELLAFAAAYPGNQWAFPIVALGSAWQYRGGRWNVPLLEFELDKRCLSLEWLGLTWPETCRFAAVPK